jgi:hypothetical protein
MAVGSAYRDPDYVEGAHPMYNDGAGVSYHHVWAATRLFLHFASENSEARNVPDFPITSARVCQRRLKMPATSKQKGELIRQHLQIEKHLDEIAKILEITVSKLKDKIKAGSWWDLSQKDAKKVLDFLQRV